MPGYARLLIVYHTTGDHMSILRYVIKNTAIKVDTKDYDDGVHTLPNGEKIWVKNGKLHCDDGPAVERHHGTKEWWVNDKRHRDDGPAYETSYCKEWFVNGLMHRDDGPAMESISGYEIWACMGKLHRLNGPAHIKPDGTMIYAIHGVEYNTLEEFELAVNKLKG